MKMLENRISNSKWVKLYFLFIIISLLHSCSNDNTSNSNNVSQTVQKKIPIAVPADKKIEVAKKETSDHQSKQDENTKSESIKNDQNKEKESGEPTKNNVSDDVSAIKQKLLSSVIQSESSDNSIVKTNPEIKQYYNPDGKLDPFKSIFYEAEVDGDKFKPKKSTRKHITPLEKFDLGQLELVGVIQSNNEYIGLVEESNGKGYVVRLGTYIGLNSGRIVEILSDKLMIEEEVVNPLGKTKVIQREMKLQKPVGE